MNSERAKYKIEQKRRSKSRSTLLPKPNSCAEIKADSLKSTKEEGNLIRSEHEVHLCMYVFTGSGLWRHLDGESSDTTAKTTNYS